MNMDRESEFMSKVNLFLFKPIENMDVIAALINIVPGIVIEIENFDRNEPPDAGLQNAYRFFATFAPPITLRRRSDTIYPNLLLFFFLPRFFGTGSTDFSPLILHTEQIFSP